MKKTIITLAIGLASLWTSSLSAMEHGIRPRGIVFPYSCGCFFHGFLGVGTHLGLGPGYPGLQAPSFGLNPFNYHRSVHAPLRCVPPVIAITILPDRTIHADNPDATSGRIEKAGTPYRPDPAPAPAGSDLRRPVPAVDDGAIGGFNFGPYTPRRYYQGEFHEISPESVFKPDAQPGIIIWIPGNNAHVRERVRPNEEQQLPH